MNKGSVRLYGMLALLSGIVHAADFSVTAQVAVDSFMVSGQPPLAEAQVRLRMSKNGDGWTTWDTSTTEADGTFTLSKSSVDEDDLFYIRMEVKLQNDQFECYDNPDAVVTKTGWHTVFDSRWPWLFSGSKSDIREIFFYAGHWDFTGADSYAGLFVNDEGTGFVRYTRNGPLVISSDSGWDEWVTYFAEHDDPKMYDQPYSLDDVELDDEAFSVRAAIWQVYVETADYLSSLSSKLALMEKIDITYPDADVCASGYADYNNNKSLIRVCEDDDLDDTLLDTILHELGHAWILQRADASIDSGDVESESEGFYDTAELAFHEGFANDFASWMIEELYADDYSGSTFISYMPQRYRACDYDRELYYREAGWRHLLGTLYIGKTLVHYDIGTCDDPGPYGAWESYYASTPEACIKYKITPWSISLQQLLEVFTENSLLYARTGNLCWAQFEATDDYTFTDFLDRLVGRGLLSAEQAEIAELLNDPNETEQFKDYFEAYVSFEASSGGVATKPGSRL